MKVIFFTTDVIPLDGLPTSGTALRSWGLINGLRSHGHEVAVSVPKSALSALSKSSRTSSLSNRASQELKGLEKFAFDGDNQPGLIARSAPDLILCGHWPALTLRSKPSQPVVIDLAGPHLLERHYQGTADHRGAVHAKLSRMALADYFIVSGHSQRLYFLSYMLRAGVASPETRMTCIPMPLDPELPTKGFPEAADDFPRFVFGGVFLPWQDPSNALKTVANELERRNSGSLKLIGGIHPHYDIKGGLYSKLFSLLARNPHVHTSPMLPYGEFTEELSRTDVAVDLMSWNLERKLAMTIRSSTYLWAGLPVIYNDYSDLALLIKEYDAGWCLPPDDETALRSTLGEIYDKPKDVREKSLNAHRLARDVFSWDRAVEPLIRLIESPPAEIATEVDILYDFPNSADTTVLRGNPVSQYFMSRIDGLSRIECRPATHEREIEKPICIRLWECEDHPENALGDPSDKNLISERLCDTNEIKNNEWLGIDVERIADSAGKKFRLEIDSEEGDPKRAVSLWVARGSPFPLLGLRVGEKNSNYKALCMRTTSMPKKGG